MASAGVRVSSEPSWIEIRRIKIIFDAEGKASEDLDVFVKDLRKERKTSRVPRDPQEPKQCLTWKLKEHCDAYEGDTIRIVSFYSRLSTLRAYRKKIDEFQFDAKAVISSYLEQSGSRSDQEFEYTLVGNNSKLCLVVNLRGLDSVTCEPNTRRDDTAVQVQIPNHHSLDDIDKLGETFDKLSSLRSLSGEVSELQTVLDAIGDSLDIVKTLEGALRTLAAAHPIIHIAVNALLIPYKLLERQHEFIDDIKVLASDMCTSFKCIAEAAQEAKLDSFKASTISLLTAIVEASQYVNDFLNKGGIMRIVAAQFRQKLDDYRISVRDRRLDFREGILVQVLVNSGAIRDRGDDLSFLQRTLKPPEQSPIGGGCMKGTRKTVLSNVEKWLENDTMPNVLWISGAPGAGKTALASTLVRELLSPDSKPYKHCDCVRFFVKRGQTALKDPRTIWRSIAYELADISRTEPWYRSVKIDVMHVMSEKSGRMYTELASIEEQFRKLVFEPLKSRFTASSISPRRIVVVIDALDECSTEDQDEWRSLLATIVKWSEGLPQACRLIVTSRVEEAIEQRLKKISYPLVLDTGDLVSDESGEDIRCFFEAKFEVKDGDSWPGQGAITTLTQYAAGLFVWATTVVNFVTQKGDRNLRLEKVLENMAKVGDKDYIGSLYAQILLASSADLELEERNSVGLVLASLVLLSEDLPRMALVTLLAPTGLGGRSSSSVKTAISSLKSVIVTEGENEILRACHKSLFEFLLDEARVKTSVKKLLDNNAPEHESLAILDTFSITRQSALLTEGCLYLMESTLNKYAIGAILPENTFIALMYACCHWPDHLQGAEVEKNVDKYSDIRIIPLVEEFTMQHVRLWLEFLSLQGSVGGAFHALRTEVNRLARTVSSRLENTVSVVQNELTSIADNVDIGALDVIANVLKQFKEFQPYTKTAVKVLLSPYELMEQHHEFVADVKILTTDMSISLKLMEGSFPSIELSHAKKITVKLLNVINDISTYLSSFVKTVDDFDSGAAARFRRRMVSYQRILRDCRLDFREAGVVQNLIESGAMRARWDDRSFLRRKLDPPTQSSMDGGILPGTRKLVMSNVDSWLRNDISSNVFWISGGPGAGKTALASTIIEKLSNPGSQPYNSYDHAFFFIKQRDIYLRNPRTIWRSIAYELANISTYRDFKVDILEVMSQASGRMYPEHALVEDQFGQLICEPLKKKFSVAESASPPKVVIIIDALDECLSENQDDWHALLRTIAKWSGELPQACKLVVTSRPEKDIVARLKDIEDGLTLDTGDIVSQDSSDDIQHFFEMKFQEMGVNVVGWPDLDSISILTDYAAGLFVWASTIIEYIRDKPVERLKEALDEIVDVTGKAGEDKLGKLYTHILVNIVSELHRPEELNGLSLVLASIVLLRRPLSMKSLRELLAPKGLEKRSLSDIDAVINSLRSVIAIATENGNDDLHTFLRIRHRSFSEFLLDEARVESCVKQSPCGISERKSVLAATSLSRQSALLAESCLWLMNSGLKFNISGIPTSHHHFEDIPNIQTLIATSIPASLEYACHYWIGHFQDAYANGHTDTHSDIHPASQIKLLLHDHTLHWLEVAHLTKWNLEKDFMIIADYMEDYDVDMSILARDASKLSNVFLRALNFNVSHIYISILPFAPINSLISKTFAPKYANTLSVLSGRRTDWDPHLGTKHVHTGFLSCVALENGSFDTQAGKFVTCGRYSIVSLDVAFEVYPSQGMERILATTKDSSWHAVDYNGEMVIIQRWHSGWKTPIIFEAKGTSAAAFLTHNALALGSFDGKLAIFDLVIEDHDEETVNASCHYVPRTLSSEHTDVIHSITSSPDGLRFVSGSSDKSLIIWDTTTGESLHRLLGHNGAVRSVAWSANGKYIVSGSEDYSVRIWNSEGGLLRNMHSYSGVTSVAFCYNNFVVSGSSDGSVRFWNRRTGNSIGQPIVRKNVGLNAMALSRDQTYLAALYDDSFVCFWDVRTTCGIGNHIARVSTGGSTERVTSMALDSDGKRVALGSKAGDVHVWDVGSGACLLSLCTGGGAIFSVQFLPKRRCVLAASRAGRLYAFSPDFGSEVQVLDISAAVQRPIAISPEGKDLSINIASPTSVMGPSGQDAREIITIWNVQVGDKQCLDVGQLEGHASRITAIAFSPNGLQIISASDDRTIRLWEVDAIRHGGMPYRELRWNHSYRDGIADDPTSRGVFSLLFSPNGEHFAVGTWLKFNSAFEAGFTIHDTSGFCLLQFPNSDARKFSTPHWLVTGAGTEGVFAPFADFSVDGQRFACSFEDRIAVWDVPAYTSEPIFDLVQDYNYVDTLHFREFKPMKLSPDGSKLVTAGPKVGARMWAIGTKSAESNTPTLQNPSSDRVDFNTFLNDHPTYLDASNGCFLDALDKPIIGDWSYIDMAELTDRSRTGFMRDSREVRNRADSHREEVGTSSSGGFKPSYKKDSQVDPCLFWLPEENRDGFWWPRNTAVMASNATKIDFTWFIHGEKWHLCRTADDG